MCRLKTVVVLVLWLVATACSQTKEQPIPPAKSEIPADFQVRFVKGGDPVLGALLFTEYNLSRDGKLIVKSEHVREITVEERHLTEEQVAVVANRISQAKLFEFARKSVELRDRCHIRETDHSRRDLEIQWDGGNVKISDDFDPRRCTEVVELSNLTNDLPELLRGSLVKTETKKAPWPRN